MLNILNNSLLSAHVGHVPLPFKEQQNNTRWLTSGNERKCLETCSIAERDRKTDKQGKAGQLNGHNKKKQEKKRIDEKEYETSHSCVNVKSIGLLVCSKGARWQKDFIFRLSLKMPKKRDE